jgi:hypothetical protein
MLISAIKENLTCLIQLLNQLDGKQYIKPCKVLSNASIGEHTRHIIEMFQCLMAQYETGIVDYDKRERNIAIQSNVYVAVNSIEIIQNQLHKENKPLDIACAFEQKAILSNYERELLYNLEHAIHHEALIKVGLYEFENIKLPENFGVAPSTIAFRKQCAQ